MSGRFVTISSNYLKRWFDKLTTNGVRSFCPFVLSDSLNRLSADSAAAESLSKDGPFWIDFLR